jgi:WD40 repeat protein
VPHHLYAAGRGDQLAALVCDLRWVTRKIAKCGVVAALADFELARELAGGGHHALMVAALAREVGRLAHVLPPGADADTVTAVLLDRIEPAGPLAGPVRALAAAYDRPWLRRVWSPPDVPHLALRRRLDDHASRITAGAVDPNRRWLATADDDGVVFVWDPVTFEPRFSLGDPANDRRSPVTASAASANGRMLVTAHQDATVRIWSPLTGRRRATIRVSEGVVRAVEFCPASRLLVTGADGGAARLWDAVRGEPGAPLLGHSATVRAVAFGPRGRNRWVATGGDDATVRVWNLPDGTRRHVLTGHAGPVRACAASADGRYLATAGDDATVRVWDPVRGQEVFPEPLRHDGPVHALAFSPDGTLLISGSDDRTVGVWNLFDGSRTDTLAVHDGPVRTVLLSPDGSVLLAASDDLVISVWDTAGRGTAGHAEPDGLLTGHTDWINVMLISPDNHWLASGGDDRTVRFWDVRRGVAGTVLTDAAEPDALVVPEAAARSRARACAAVGDGRFVVAGDEGALRLWDARRGRVQRVWAGEAVAGGAAELVACAADPAEDLYAVADLRGTAALWRSGSDEPVARLVEDHGGPLHCLDLDPESGVLLAGGEHGLRLWERPVLAAAAGSVAEVSTRVEHPGVRAARLTTGATRIVVGDEAGEVHLYARHHLDGATAVRWEARLGRHERPVTALAVSADGRFAASGSDDGEAVLWNLVLGREFRPLDGAFGAVRDLAFDPTSTWLALLGEQAGIEVWDVTAGRPAARLPVDGALRGCCWVDADTLCAVGSRGVHVFALAGFATRAPAVTQRRRGYDVRGGDTTELPGDAIPDDADDRDLPGGVVEGEGVGARVEVAVGGGAVNPVFRVFLGANAWVALAELYPDAATARVFLSGLGLPVGRLPAMTAGMGPETYWFQVCQTVDHGVSATIGLAELAEAAAAEWPRNRTLAALALAARAAESGGQAAG